MKNDGLLEKLWSIQNPLVIAFTYLVLCFATFSSSLHNGFLLDDYPMLIENPQIETQDFLEIKFGGLKKNIYFRPVTHALNYITFGLFGHHPEGYHLFNLSLFYLSLLSLHSLLFLIFKDHLFCFLTCALFCVHPINGILINYKNATGYSLLVLAMNLSLFNYYSWAGNSASRIHLVNGTMWFLIALMCHEVSIVFPLYLAIILFFTKEYSLKKIFLACAPSILIVIMFVIFRSHVISQRQSMIQNILLFGVNLTEYVASFVTLVGWYLQKLLTLKDIVLIWETPIVRHGGLLRLILVIMGATSFLASLFYFKRSLINLGLSWLLVGFVPVTIACFSRPNLGFIIEPHWMTYSSIGFFMLLSLALLWIKRHARNGLWAILLIGLMAFNLANAWRYNYLWGNQKRYCQYWLTVMPYNFMPNFWLGYSLMEEENYAEAEKVYEFLSRKVNKIPETYGNLGIVKYHLNRLDEAARYFNESLALDDKNPNTYYYLGLIYHQKGEFTKAQEFLDHCLALDSHFIVAKQLRDDRDRINADKK